MRGSAPRRAREGGRRRGGGGRDGGKGSGHVTCKIIVTSRIVNPQPGAYTWGMPKRYGQACPVAKSLEVLGDRWTLLIVRDLLRGTRRFQDLQAGLPGIAPNILSDRLKLMERQRAGDAQLLLRPSPAGPVHADRARAGAGRVVGALADWGSRHVYKRTRLVHADCGHEVRLGYHCEDCGTRVRGGSGEAPTSGPRARGLRRAAKPAAKPADGALRPPLRPGGIIRH